MTAAAVLLALAVLAVPARPNRLCVSVIGTVVEPGAVNDPHAVAGALDLFAACLRAGLDVGRAARAVAPVAPEPLSGALGRAGYLLSLGADSDAAWTTAEGDPVVDSVARTVRRSARSGSSVADAVADAARDHRARAEDGVAAAGERAGVLVSGPLGLCFLPAFVCLGIVPVVLGLAGTVLRGGLL